MMRPFRISMIAQSLLVLAVLLSMGSNAIASEKRAPKLFKYVGGTEKLPASCQGLVEVGSSELSFKCPEGSVSVPYASITVMQYRPDISKKIRKMKIDWKVKPNFGGPLLGGNRKNRYFTIVYQNQGTTGALVLDVPPGIMRPYLAEIDVKVGKRVEVKETEEVD